MMKDSTSSELLDKAKDAIKRRKSSLMDCSSAMNDSVQSKGELEIENLEGQEEGKNA